MNAERQRLHTDQDSWKLWGPYLSERQWGTVREDYSSDGNAWSYFPHDQARSRAYRWGEDGLAGISDAKQRLCFAVALWNGRDAILKERLFGLTNSEGNHGEDVKEIYYYLDSTPTHSYMKYLYKYPQAAYPYEDLVATNGGRSAKELEYELADTGVFDEDRYFDVFVEYAKASTDDILIRITVANRGPDAANCTLLPTLWFRNTWSWGASRHAKPGLQRHDAADGVAAIRSHHPRLGAYTLYAAEPAGVIFTENESNVASIFGGENTSPFVKDAFHRFIIDGDEQAVNPAGAGTKAAAVYRLAVPAGGAATVHLRLSKSEHTAPFADFAQIMAKRIDEADAFYADMTPPSITPEAAAVLRQALAGMLWTKQYYEYDVMTWLREHGLPNAEAVRRASIRNKQWRHMYNADIISMPDKWEYPWYAAWDLAFHTLPLGMVDIDFAKEQLALMLSANYIHPNGQIPAYEWNFGDVNPPVQAWAAVNLFRMERHQRGQGDVEFLKSIFNKLMLNFTWWVNRKDADGNNVFEGGFLGLDNIGVFDRSAPLPTGGYLEQSDGTSWMAFYALMLLRMALDIAVDDPGYQDMVVKLFEHFLWIKSAMDRIGEDGADMWDREDGFFYDVLHFPDGSATRLKVRSLVGLMPLAACAVIQPEMISQLPGFMKRLEWLREMRPELFARIAEVTAPGIENRRLLAVLDEDALRRILARMLDEEEFLSDFGIRSLSRFHKDNPYVFYAHGGEYRVDYLPAESDSGMFGGNSNWRGPIWLPMNVILLRGLVTLHAYYGDEFKVECPTGSGQYLTLWEVSREIAGRLIKIFLPGADGRRPVFGDGTKYQTDPHWRDHLLFYEYFHGDNGAGLGASHQTGWTGLVAWLIEIYGSADDFESFYAEHIRDALPPAAR